jgi:hypothetical protein
MNTSATRWRGERMGQANGLAYQKEEGRFWEGRMGWAASIHRFHNAALNAMIESRQPKGRRCLFTARYTPQ